MIVEGQSAPVLATPLAPWISDHSGKAPTGNVAVPTGQRSYIATWEVVGRRLLLRRVEVVDGERTGKVTRVAPVKDKDGTSVAAAKRRQRQWVMTLRDVRADLFPDVNEVVATWYTGALVVPRDEVVTQVGSRLVVDYLRYTLYDVRAGNVVQQKTVSAEDYLELCKERFLGFKKTQAYRQKMSERTPLLGAWDAEQSLFESEVERYLFPDAAESTQ